MFFGQSPMHQQFRQGGPQFRRYWSNNAAIRTLLAIISNRDSLSNREASISTTSFWPSSSFITSSPSSNPNPATQLCLPTTINSKQGLPFSKPNSMYPKNISKRSEIPTSRGILKWWLIGSIWLNSKRDVRARKEIKRDGSSLHTAKIQAKNVNTISLRPEESMWVPAVWSTTSESSTKTTFEIWPTWSDIMYTIYSTRHSTIYSFQIAKINLYNNM